jgi:hypothetical protein
MTPRNKHCHCRSNFFFLKPVAFPRGGVTVGEYPLGHFLEGAEAPVPWFCPARAEAFRFGNRCCGGGRSGALRRQVLAPRLGRSEVRHRNIAAALPVQHLFRLFGRRPEDMFKGNLLPRRQVCPIHLRFVLQFFAKAVERDHLR